MKKKFRKIICILITTVMILTIIGNISLASNATVINQVTMPTGSGIWGTVSSFLDGVAGIASGILRIPLLLIAIGIHALITGIATLGGTNASIGFLTPDDMFFNELKITDINFFDFSQPGTINTIRENVAQWYYVMRIFAMVILLAILIYVGIRMAISTVASDKAQYKKMLIDWAVSFALIFVLNYIIIFTITVNDGLVNMLRQPARVQFGQGLSDQLIKEAAIGKATVTWTALLVYCMLLGLSLNFLINYIKRMLTVGFLIIISPLITITYSIDKMGDGKAQALNSWMKEFMLNVLIQPFHCILFLVFASASIELIQSDGSLAALVLSIICMGFINRGEKIIREIFGFSQASSLGETVASIAAVKTIGSAATKAGSTVMKNSKFGKNISNKISSSKFAQSKARKSNRHSWKFQQKSFAICCWRNECCIRSWT